MKIVNIEITHEEIPLKKPFITALRRVDNVEFVRVKVQCDSGLFAYGEAPATKAITGEDLDDIQNSLELIKPKLLLKSIDEALEILHASSIGTSAKASLDMAFVSILGEKNNQKLFTYLGGSTLSFLQTDITISLNKQRKMLQDSIDAYNDKCEILKIKLGSDIDHAIAVTHDIAKSLPDAKLLIDANQAWNFDKTTKFIEAMKDISIELIEQPVPAKEIDSLKKITQLSHIPILADEAAFSLEDVRYIIQTQSADMINIKLMKCAGVTKAVEILEYAKEHKVYCMLGSMLEGPYSINVALHLAVAYKDVIRYIDLDSPLLYRDKVNDLDFEFDHSYIRLKE